MPVAAIDSGREARSTTPPSSIDPRIVEAGLVDEYPFASRWLGVDGGRMHYVDEGPRDSAPLLMLHGNPTWSFFYRRLIQAFRGEHRCVAPDHLGCGLSDKPQDWRYDLVGHIRNLEALVLALDLRDITLVLHDWGGPIGLGFARRHPERIARLVILNTAAFPGPVPWSLRLGRTPGLGPFLVRRLNLFAGLAPRLAVVRPLSKAARAGYALPYRTAADRVAVARFVRDIPVSPKDPSWQELAGIDADLGRFRALPACIVWGERDFVFTPWFREEWRRRFPGAEVQSLPDAGHWLLEDEPRSVESAFRRCHANST
jgi:pimeloyl-ACP methyl ester carboxylesterase